MGLVAGDADLVAWFYDLGSAAGPMRPVARGELGRVWRLPTVGGVVAVKELFVPPTEDEAAADVGFQLGARRAGVLLPSPVRRTGGRVLAVLPSGVTVRVYEWMDLRPRLFDSDEPIMHEVLDAFPTGTFLRGDLHRLPVADAAWTSSCARWRSSTCRRSLR